uniref:(Fe-S)-binding protein n=1 Tax=Bilophila wadsworthia TaxID=35833 RepID=UPI00266C7C1C
YWELINEGKIKITHQFEDSFTIHDPCITFFGRGLADKLRDVVHFLCANVVEMTPNREHNFCCSAGGGIINCGPPFKSVRMEGNRVKADQLRNTGVHTVVAPCHNCHGGLEDIIKHYKLGMHTKFIGDLIYELMEKPEV